MIGENFPFIIGVSIISIIFILSFFQVYSSFLESEKRVKLHRQGLAILNTLVENHENGGINCSKWKNRTHVNYKIEHPECSAGRNITINQTEELIKLSSPILLNNKESIRYVNVSIWG